MKRIAANRNYRMLKKIGEAGDSVAIPNVSDIKNKIDQFQEKLLNETKESIELFIKSYLEKNHKGWVVSEVSANSREEEYEHTTYIWYHITIKSTEALPDDRYYWDTGPDDALQYIVSAFKEAGFSNPQFGNNDEVGPENESYINSGYIYL